MSDTNRGKFLLKGMDCLTRARNQLSYEVAIAKNFLIERAMSQGKAEIIIASTIKWENNTATVVVKELHDYRELKEFNDFASAIEMYRLID